MRLRIISEGTTATTRVVNDETGEPVLGVVSISIEKIDVKDGHHLVNASIGIMGIGLDMVAEVKQDG